MGAMLVVSHMITNCFLEEVLLEIESLFHVRCDLLTLTRFLTAMPDGLYVNGRY